MPKGIKGFQKGNVPVHTFPKGVYQGHGFKKGNTFAKGRDVKGEKNPRFKGRIMRNGYWLVFKPDHPFCNKGKRVQEHRLVMEKQIGRFLSRQECVHHINGDKGDNRIENLMLFSNNAEHHQYHALCRKILRTQSQGQKDTTVHL